MNLRYPPPKRPGEAQRICDKPHDIKTHALKMAVLLYNRAFPVSFNYYATYKSCGWPLAGVSSGFLASIIFVVYLCLAGEQAASNYHSSSLHLTSRYSLDQMKSFALKNTMAINFKPSLYVRNLSFNQISEDAENRFDIEANDVIVFIHIQKTAGTTFERFLVKYLNISRPCECSVGGKKRCDCLRPKSNNRDFWLFSRYSTGWACGLHSDFTELISGCVDRVMDNKEGKHNKRRYYYTTFLRDPVERFISEYSHVKRGATWLAARHICNGRRPSAEELPMCFDPEIGWEGVELDEFLSCPFNLAFNRQTRMLADLTLVNCYDTSSMDQSTRNSIMLESAKTNLKNFAFFGIKERMNESQRLFEKLFDMKFTRSMGVWNKSKSQHTVITPARLDIIREQNHLDIEFYKFAVKLFERRLNMLATEESYPQELAMDPDSSQPPSCDSPSLMNASITVQEEISTTINSVLNSSSIFDFFGVIARSEDQQKPMP